MSEEDEEQQLCNSKPPASSSGLGSLSGRRSWYGMPAPSNVKKQATQSNNNQLPPQIQLAREAGEVERSECAKRLPTNYRRPKAARKLQRPRAASPAAQGRLTGRRLSTCLNPTLNVLFKNGQEGTSGDPTASSLLQNSAEDKRTTAASR